MALPNDDRVTVSSLGKLVCDSHINTYFGNNIPSISFYFSDDDKLDEGAFIFTLKRKKNKVFYYFELPIDEVKKATIPDDVLKSMKHATFKKKRRLTAVFAHQFESLKWSLVGQIQYNNV